MEGWSKKIEMKERSNENSPKRKLEMQDMCRTCEELRKVHVPLSLKCQIYERQIESQQKIAKLNQVVALLTQQIAEKITENSMLRVENDANKGDKVKKNHIQGIDKFLEIKMETPNEDLRKKDMNKEQDVESNSEMGNSENSDDIQVLEEDEDEETEESVNEKQVLICAWMVRDDKGTSARCGRVFPSPKDLASHFKKDHLNADLSGIYICRWDGCKRSGEPFKERHNLTVHFRAHSGERPYRCPFEGCDKAFTQITALNSHSGVHSKSTHPCLDPGCPKVFSRKSIMMAHYRVKHSGERQGFACPMEDIGKVFEYNHVLRNHMATHWRFQCKFPRCFQSFPSKQSLDEHSETHGPVEGHECPFNGCGRKFPDARAVQEHVMITHTGETPYVCPYECGKAFSRERDLKMHMNAHSKETDTNMLRVECDANKGGKVEANKCRLGGNNLPDIDKFGKTKMDIPNEDKLRKKGTVKEQDVESCSEMETMENSEDEETEATLDEKRVLTCAWMVRDDKGTSARCGRVFPSSADLASHSRKAHLHRDSHMNYICSWDGCKRNGEPFKDRHNLTVHFRAHSGERPYRCPFEGCNRAFAQVSSLNAHRSLHSKSMHPCLDPECPKVFTQKSRMMSHYRVRHTGESKGSVCPVEDCGKVFDYNHELRKHLRTHWRYQCKFPGCNRSFASQQLLDEHSERPHAHSKETDTAEPL